MPKVYLSPSNQTSNKCKQGDSECDHCNLFTDHLVRYFDACGIDYKRAGKTETLANRVKASNSYKPDVHYCIHTNAGGGKRCVLFGYSITDKLWLSLANAIKSERSKIYKNEIRFTKKTDFYEIKATTAKCMYDEVLFHDSDEESKFFHDNMKELAKATAKGFCEHFNISFVDPDAAAPEVNGDVLSLQTRLDAANEIIRNIQALAKEQ